MTIARGAGLLLILAATAVGAVAFRAGTVSRSWRIQQLHSRETLLRRQLWTAQCELARLTAPGRIRQAVSDMRLCLRPPRPDNDERLLGAVAQAGVDEGMRP